jgi:hypothetical protein
MTLARKLAVGISERVVRWASPGCKEWAEAQSRELAVVENDWAALSWALGSAQVLLDRRGTSRSEIPARPSYLYVIFWLFCLEACLWTCAKMLTSTVWTQRLGWGLLLLTWAYCATCSVFNWLRERWQPPLSDIQAYRLFLREGLELKLTRYRTVRRWFPVCAGFCGWLGWLLIVRGEVHFWGYFVCLVWLLLNPLDTPAKIQSRIERMDALIAKWRPGNLKFDVKRVHSDHWGRP